MTSRPQNSYLLHDVVGIPASLVLGYPISIKDGHTEVRCYVGTFGFSIREAHEALPVSFSFSASFAHWLAFFCGGHTITTFTG